MKYLVILLFVALVSCDSSRVYEDYYDLEEAFWHKDSVKRFEFRIDDTALDYNVSITFRNSSRYPFYNIYYQYTLQDSLNNVLLQELEETNLFDPKTGQPYGNGLGDLFDHEISLLENYSFDSPGPYSLSLQQFMRMDTLPFVLSIGSRVEIASEN